MFKKIKNINLKNVAEELNRHFTREDIQMANRLMERCSISLIIQEMQVKTIVRYYLIPCRIAIVKKIRNNEYW